MVSIDKKFEETQNLAKLYPGTNSEFNPDTVPGWFEEAKFRKAQQTINKYFFSFVISAFIGFVLSMLKREVVMPFLYNGKHKNVQSIFCRYLNTISHMMVWYNSDPFDKNSESYKSLKLVRSYHLKVSHDMNNESGKIEGKDRIFGSQHDMMFGQFTVMGILVLYPKQSGLHSISDEEFKDFIYFWRVIGYCLGIDDKYNLCSGTTPEVIAMCRRIFEEEWHPFINTNPPYCPPGEELAKGICFSLNPVMGAVNWNVMTKYFFPVLNITKPTKLETLTEYLWYYFFVFLMTFGLKFSIIRLAINKMFKNGLAMATRYKTENYEKLKKQYQHISYKFPGLDFLEIPIGSE